MNSQLESWNWFHETLRQPTGVKTVEGIFQSRYDAEEIPDLSDQDIKSDLVEYRAITWIHNEYVRRLKEHGDRMASEYGKQCVADLVMSVGDALLDSSLLDFGNAILKQVDERDL